MIYNLSGLNSKKAKRKFGDDDADDEFEGAGVVGSSSSSNNCAKSSAKAHPDYDPAVVKSRIERFECDLPHKAKATLSNPK